jgi:hypothetical protein
LSKTLSEDRETELPQLKQLREALLVLLDKHPAKPRTIGFAQTKMLTEELGEIISQMERGGSSSSAAKSDSLMPHDGAM